MNTRHTDSECTHGSSWPHCFVSSKGRSFLLTSSGICIPRCLSYEDVVTLRTFDFISHALSIPLFGASCCVPKAQVSGKGSLGRERARGRVVFLHGKPFVRVKIPSLYCNSGFDKNGFESIGDLWLVFLNQSCYLRLTAKVLLLWYFLKAALAVKGLQMRPLWDNFTGGCWRQFFAHNWGWKPCKHKIRQKTRANGVVVVVFLNCLLNKNRGIYARHPYVTFHCRLLRANYLYTLYKP